MATVRGKTTPMDWQPHEPPLIVVGALVLDRWRTADGPALRRFDLDPGVQAEVSYNVTAELRGQGIAPRALSALLAWAATQIGLRRAHLSCHFDNAASQRVAKKCGFSYLGQDGDEYKFERELDLRGGPIRPPSS